VSSQHSKSLVRRSARQTDHAEYGRSAFDAETQLSVAEIEVSDESLEGSILVLADDASIQLPQCMLGCFRLIGVSSTRTSIKERWKTRHIHDGASEPASWEKENHHVTYGPKSMERIMYFVQPGPKFVAMSKYMARPP
jgi:hypothetical protein